MADIDIRIQGRAGRITLNRPAALNALSYDMALHIETALRAWEHDPAVALVIIDAAGDRAFCAGGDIQQMYDTASAGDFEFGRRFWADEYRLNAYLSHYPKPYVALMHGFTMGGGVGISCHGSHRIVCENSQIAMPECGIGLVPDVGGSFILARAPGRLGEYLGCTAARMGPGDAILAGFADYYIPRAAWPDLVQRLCETGSITGIPAAAQPAPPAELTPHLDWINQHFTADSADLITGFDTSPFARTTEKALRRNCPLSVAATLALVRAVRRVGSIEHALRLEYRFTYRAATDGDFIEGIRAAVIDKDRKPRWKHADLEHVTPNEISFMLSTLGENELTLNEGTI